MLVRATTDDPPDTGADTIVVGVFDGKGIPHDTSDGALGALVESGEARSEFRSLTHTHAAGRRWILVGLGARDEFDAERARIAAAVELGRVGGEAANRARDLGNAPPNALTPAALAARARELPGVRVDVMGRAEIEAAGMGAFAAIARGAGEEPQLITVRHEPPGAAGPLLGVVGKAVTFDSGR